MVSIVRTVPPLPSTERGDFTTFSFDKAGERVLYTNNNNVLWRSWAPMVEGKAAEKPDDVFVNPTHARKAICVAMSPNNEWVVSGDQTGAVKLWGAKGEHIVKNEFKLWDGPVKAVAWSDDSTRIFACGDGKETRAVALLRDTGSKTGEVAGHSKMVNAISFRAQRPFRLVTGSEDMTVVFHQGPPFKFLKSDNSHSNFVNWVGYSPDGEYAASAGSDSKLLLFSKDGDLVKEFEKPAGMTGSIWAAAWSPDSNRIATAGGDKKLRIWDREAGKQVGELLIGKGALEDMQVGICWPKGNTVVSLCLDGRLLSLEVSADGVPTLAATIDGTQGALTCLGRDSKTGTLVAGSSDGTVAILPTDQSAKHIKIGKTVQHVICHTRGDSGEAWIISLDNFVRRVSLATGEFVGEPVEIKELATGASWLDESETKLIIGSSKGTVHCISDKSLEWSKPGLTVRPPTAFAAHAGTRAAFAMEKPDGMVGGIQSNQFDIQLFDIKGATSADGVVESALLQGHTAEVGCLSFSPSGEFLASGDSDKTIKIWCLNEIAAKGAAGGAGYSAGEAPAIQAQMAFQYNGHSARVTCLAWMPSGNTLISGSLDQNITVWNVDVENKKVKMNEALVKDRKATSCNASHRGGVAALSAISDSEFASVGSDGFLNIHKIA